MRAWYVGGQAYIDIDDAVEAVVRLVEDREMAIYTSTHGGRHAMIFQEARAVLQYMSDGDVHDFMGVLITAGYSAIGV